MSDPDVDEDAALVQRCRQGEAAAWAALVRRHHRLVNAIALRAGLDEHAAADVLQTVFTRLLQHLSRLQRPERLRAWVVTTAKRETLQQLAIRRRTVSMTTDDAESESHPALQVADDAPLTEDLLSELQQLDLLRRGLDRLDERCRSLLLALHGDDDTRLSYEELARRLGMPLGSLGPTRGRCLGKLRRLVEGAASGPAGESP